MKAPLFSIIIPTYNRPKAWVQLVEELKRQRCSDYEIIIVDDSQDEQRVEFTDLMRSNRLQYLYRGAKLGVSSARNHGAHFAHGEYLAFLDDDDQVSDNWLIDFADVIENNNRPDYLLCGMERIEDTTSPKKVFLPSKNMIRIIFPGAYIIKKSVFEILGGYDERLHYGENTELFFRIRESSARYACTDAINYFYYPSVDGGSKNLLNIVESNKIVLSKHAAFFARQKRLKKNYQEVTGVSLLRLRKFDEGMYFLKQALIDNPLDIKSVVRYLITHSKTMTQLLYK